MNVFKTKEMCIDFRKNQRCPKLVYIKGEAVERVDTYKYLGVVFDSKLNWKENINSVLKKVVTKCICTLCLCSCMYLGYVALSFRVCTSVNLYVCVTCCDLDITMRRH